MRYLWRPKVPTYISALLTGYGLSEAFKFPLDQSGANAVQQFVLRHLGDLLIDINGVQFFYHWFLRFYLGWPIRMTAGWNMIIVGHVDLSLVAGLGSPRKFFAEINIFGAISGCRYVGNVAAYQLMA